MYSESTRRGLCFHLLLAMVHTLSRAFTSPNRQNQQLRDKQLHVVAVFNFV
jgi:hypothetical protein